MKKLKLFLLSVLLIIATTGMAHLSMADTIALTFTGGTPFTYVDKPLPNTIGWEFGLAAPVTVMQLGFYDVGPVDQGMYSSTWIGPDGDGLIANHAVAIWDVNSQNQIVSAVVTNSDPLDQGFRWVSVSPTTLGAGTYRIGALVNDDDWYFTATATQTSASPVSYVGGVYLLDGFAYPAEIGYANYGRFGPDFQFNPVPLPGAVWFLGCGLLGLAGLRRFRKG
jgi:hypothetical protein